MTSCMNGQTGDFITIYEALPGRFMVKLREELAAQGRIDEGAYDFLNRTMPDDVKKRILHVIAAEWAAIQSFLTERFGTRIIGFDEGMAALDECEHTMHGRSTTEITLILASWAMWVKKESKLMQDAVSAAL
jgi:hypothetical protein